MTIVYVSNTGFTKRYAFMLGKILGVSVYSLEEAKKQVKKHSPIIFFSWLFAGKVKKIKKVLNRFDVKAVCAVGLSDTGAAVQQVISANSIEPSIAVFTLQGGMTHSKLTGINKFMINMLIKALSAKNDKTKEEERMLFLIKNGGDFVEEQHLAKIIAWYRKNNK